MVMHSNDISVTKFAETTYRGQGKSVRLVHRQPVPQTKLNLSYHVEKLGLWNGQTSVQDHWVICVTYSRKIKLFHHKQKKYKQVFIIGRTCHHNKNNNNKLFVQKFYFICTLCLRSKEPKRPTLFPAPPCYERRRLERIGFQERCACNKVSNYDKNYDILNYRYTELKKLT